MGPVLTGCRCIRCEAPLDLVFVLDNSGSAAEFIEDTVDFVYSIIAQFQLGQNSTRVALVEFTQVRAADGVDGSRVWSYSLARDRQQP